MELVLFLGKLLGTAVVAVAAYTALYRLAGGASAMTEIRKYGRPLTVDEAMSPTRQWAVLAGTAVATYLVVWVWLRWF